MDGSSPDDLANLITSNGGTLVSTLPPGLMRAADLTAGQAQAIAKHYGVEVTPDVTVSVQASTGIAVAPRTPADEFAQQTGATTVWSNQKDTGAGVNVAVLDTGISQLPDFNGRLVSGVDLTGAGNPFLDSYGHGTFVAGLIAGNGMSSGGQYTGEAPGAGLVSVKVAGATGQTDLATVIAGVQWVIQHAASLNIRVLNMSLGFQPFESSALNPLDQVVQQAWDAGVVVVASAGNAGPFNGTILSPGDDPSIITVGSVDDGGQTNTANDVMSGFSSVGPTSPDGWAKPDIVTSGRSVVSLRDPGSTIDLANPSAVIGTSNFVGTGTSFSAAIVSGAVALLLAKNGGLHPNDVKADLLGNATPGPSGNPFVDGHGLLNVAAAVAHAGLHVQQNVGDAGITGADGDLQVKPGDTMSAGIDISVGGPHPQATVSILGSSVNLPMSCVKGGPTTGGITVPVATGPYSVAQNSNAQLPTGDGNSPASFQGSTTAPDLCSGGPMFNKNGTFWAEITSTDTNDPLQVMFHYADTTTQPGSPWSPKLNVVPAAGTSSGTTVNLAQLWSQSTWNPQLWGGLPAPPPSPPLTGTAWNGTAWNGSDWNGVAWNGTAWNGTAWNGAAWNGTAWNGNAWDGTAWNGTAWNGAAWNGVAWNSDFWG